MGKHDKKQKQKLAGPWRNIHGAVWLIGLAILAIKGWWWPGILVLVAVSMVVEALITALVPGALEEEQPEPPVPLPGGAAPPAPAAPAPEYRPELLPVVCPRCGGPIRGHEVKWTGLNSADCPFCGANLPMRKGEPGASG